MSALPTMAFGDGTAYRRDELHAGDALLAMREGVYYAGQRDLASRHPTRKPALVHESKLTRGRPNREVTHRPILYDSGRPTSVI